MAGLYAILSYSVSLRAREIGIRMALGAERRQIFLLVVQHASKLLCVGILIGLFTALIAAPFLQPALFNVSIFDWSAFGAAIVTVAGAAMLAC